MFNFPSGNHNMLTPPGNHNMLTPPPGNHNMLTPPPVTHNIPTPPPGNHNMLAPPPAPPPMTITPWDAHLDNPNLHAVDVWLMPDKIAHRHALLGLDRHEVLSFSHRCEFVSLGCFCGIARALQSVGLKKWSYPFDWTRSPMEGIIHCLDSRFEDFLTFASFRHEGALKVFESTRWGGSFWHHDLEAPGTKEAFVRRIHRMLGHGDVQATTSRVYIRAVNSTREVESALQLRDALQRANPQAYIYLLIIIDLQSVKGAMWAKVFFSFASMKTCILAHWL